MPMHKVHGLIRSKLSWGENTAQASSNLDNTRAVIKCVILPIFRIEFTPART
jgi:hypothetical protein